jgi:hypothetical protein
MAATNINELASQLIQQIGSFFERISASPSRGIAQFPVAGQSNYLYVLYSGSGMPLHAGCVVGERGRGPREAQSLLDSGAVASFRTVELGDENLATQLDRLIRELFAPALPFVGRGDGQSAAPSTNGRRRGRPPGSGAATKGRRGRRARTQDAAAGKGNGRRGRRKAAPAEGVVKRGPGRPRKNAAAEEKPRRGPGRPRKNAAEAPVAAAPRRKPGRPRKNAAEAEAPRRRGPGRPRKNAETAAGE